MPLDAFEKFLVQCCKFSSHGWAVPADVGANYEAYKSNIRQKIAKSDELPKAEIVEFEVRQGFGLAVREGLRLAETKYVLVMQVRTDTTS